MIAAGLLAAVPLWPGDTDPRFELAMLGLAFVLSAVIGMEREIRQKSAGLRTHAIVGTGSAVFTLVSSHGFALAPGGPGDPARIAAQVVTGIGFLGAGVIFTRRDVVRGLTTAAAIWITAAVGMASGAGMPLLAASATGAYVLAAVVLHPLVVRLPPRGRRTVVVRYADRAGVLRRLLAEATTLGFSTDLLSAQRVDGPGAGPEVEIRARFRGKHPLDTLVAALHEIDGVRAVETLAPDEEEEQS